MYFVLEDNIFRGFTGNAEYSGLKKEMEKGLVEEPSGKTLSIERGWVESGMLRRGWIDITQRCRNDHGGGNPAGSAG